MARSVSLYSLQIETDSIYGPGVVRLAFDGSAYTWSSDDPRVVINTRGVQNSTGWPNCRMFRTFMQGVGPRQFNTLEEANAWRRSIGMPEVV